MGSRAEKGGGAFSGIKLLLCENPLPPIDEAIAAAQVELRRSNFYTEAHSAPLRRLISAHLGVAERLIHINAGSELILRQLFDRFGQQVHLLTPTYPLFYEIARCWSETRLLPEHDFAFDLAALSIPDGTTLAVIVNPNNPNGGTFDMAPLPGLLAAHPRTRFLVDEAFIGLAGESVAALVPQHPNLLVTRTLSKAHSLAGFRVGYAVLPAPIADDLNAHNDAYPLARASEAAAIATLQHEDKIRERAALLRAWTAELAAQMRAIGVRTFPTDTYFFLADFAPHDAEALSRALAGRGILVKPLGDARLGPGYMRITTALPEENARFVTALGELLSAVDAARRDTDRASDMPARRAPASVRASNTLSEFEIGVLLEALDDEYRAWATYDQVIADFGDVRPFSNIRDAEARHIQALAALFARYEVHMPVNPWPGRVERYASLHAACEAGVVAEMANAALYERLIASTQRPDILRVLRRLQEASQERHLRAFRRCVQRGSGHGGRGCGGRGRTLHRR